MATNLRFVILGDDRAGAAFNRFAASVDRANRSVAANQRALDKQSASSDKASKSIIGLAGSVTGASDVFALTSGEGGRFAKVLAAINAGTGILEPALASVAVILGATASAATAAAIGLGGVDLVMKPIISRTQALAQLQQQAAAGSKTAQKQLKAELKTTPPVIVAFSKSISGAQKTYQKWAFSLAKPVLRPFTAGLKLVGPVLRALSPAVRVAASTLTNLEKRLDDAVRGGGLRRWIAAMQPAIGPAIKSAGIAIGNIVRGVGGLLKAFVPEVPKMASGLDMLTAKFAKWGTTITSHSGFQSLIGMFKTDGPLLLQILKNLASAATHFGGTMSALSTPSNSTSLLRLIAPLSSLLNKLSQNKGLVQAVLYFSLMKSVLGQVKTGVTGVSTAFTSLKTGYTGLKTGLTYLTNFRAGMTNTISSTEQLGTAAFASGAKFKAFTASIWAGIVGIKSWTIWSKIAAVATKIWAGIQAVWNAIMDANPLILISIALIALIALIVIAYKKSATFRAIVQDAFHVFLVVVQAVWGWIKAHWPLLLIILLGPIGLAIDEMVKHWHTVWGVIQTVFFWIRDHWPLVAGILTAGIAPAIIWIVKHWSEITTAVSLSITWIRVHMDDFANFIFGIFQKIIDGAAKAFSWVPGLGPLLKTAAQQFADFRTAVNNALLGINNRTVTVGVDFAPGGAGPHLVGQKAGGGLINGPGGPTDDKAGLFWLSDKEYVMPAKAVRRYGVGFMDKVRAGHLAAGGLAVRDRMPGTLSMEAAVAPTLAQLAKRLLASGGFTSALGAAIVNYAESFIGKVPYLWGGTTTAGWDCSGFTDFVFRHFGISLPRTAAQQQAYAKRIPFGIPGALTFFAGADGTASSAGHVGIYVGGGKYVSAYGTGFGTLIEPVIGSSGAFGGYGLPPGRRFARGGMIREPVAGIGLRSRARYMFGEAGPEYVGGSDMTKYLKLIAALLGELIEAVDASAGSTAHGVSRALGGAARSAAYQSLYSAS